jgi:hypothetical protein
MAVWALRVGCVGPAVAIGVIIWLAAAVTLVGFFRAAASAVRQSPVLSIRPGCAKTEQVRGCPRHRYFSSGLGDRQRRGIS